MISFSRVLPHVSSGRLVCVLLAVAIPASASATPTDVEAASIEIRALESRGEFAAAGARWADMATATRDPLMFLYANAAWIRAFEVDGDAGHLCASLGLADALLAGPDLVQVEEDRQAIDELRAALVARIEAAGGCPRASVPLIDPTSEGSSALAMLRPAPAAVVDAPESAGAEARAWKIAGGVTLGMGSLLAVTSIAAGIDVGVASRSLAEIRDRHRADGTALTETEQQESAAIYARGEGAQAIAIATGAAAAIVLTTGAVLLGRGQRIERRGLAAAPHLSPSAIGLCLGGRF